MPKLPPALAALADAAEAVARRSATARLLQTPPDPLSRREVERVLKAAWGRPVAKVLDELEDEPVRHDGAGQTHRAVRDGDPVAVEVQRPGVATAVRGDLVLLDALIVPAAAAFPAADVGGLLREIRERALDDLDLEHGASVQRAVRRALRGDERAVVPAPDTELAAPDVLVTDWVDGRPVAAGDAALLVDVPLRLAAEHGWVVVDHRPELTLVDDDGRLVLLGAARSVRMPVERVAQFAAALRGLREGDAAPIAALGALPAGDEEAALAVGRHVLGPLVDGPARLDLAAVEQAAQRAQSRDAFALVPRTEPQAADLWPGRGALQLGLTLATLGATEDWAALALAALERG